MFKEFITFLGTENLKATSDFYQNILELTIYKDQGDCLIFNINTQSKIGFCTHIPHSSEEKTPILTLVTDKVDEFYNFLIRKDVEIKEKPRISQKFKIYHFFFNDPNGYTIEIQKFLD
jgi:catechol 2,3-dioxygenase-like lactoylglutathione lyase family enzyme